MPSYLFKADGKTIAMPLTPQGEAWSWLELGSGGTDVHLWLINLFSRTPVLQLSATEDLPRIANALRPIAADALGSGICQELDTLDVCTGRIYNISRSGVILYTEDSSTGDAEFNRAEFDSAGKLWSELAADDARLKISSGFNYVAHTRADSWSASIGAGAAALMINAGRIAGRVYATQRSGSEPQTFGYFDLAGNWNLLVTFGSNATGRGIVGLDDNIYIGKSEVGEFDKLQKYDQDGTLISEIVLTDADPNQTALRTMVYDGVGRIWIHGEGEGPSYVNAWCVNAGAMEVVIYGPVSAVNMIPGPSFNGQSAVAVIETPITGFNVVGIFQFNPRIDSASVDLGNDIVKPLALRSGLQESEINVSSIIGNQVIGYVIPSRSQVREMIEPLMGVFFFDAVESDDTVKFVSRGNLSSLSIPEDDLGAAQDVSNPGEELLKLERKQEMELPVVVNLAYMSAVSDYESQQQPSRRLITQAKESMTLSVPVVLSDDQARQAADCMMFSAWVERTTQTFATTRKYARYEPTDVITVTRDGVSHLVRVMEKDYGANGVIRWRTAAEEPSIYTQFSIGVPAPSPESEVFPAPPSIAILLDIPMLREPDNDPGFYFAAYSGAPEDWAGNVLYQSQDTGGSYLQLNNADILQPSNAGVALAALPQMPRLLSFFETGEPSAEEFNELFDETNTVDIQMASGSLASATRDEVLNGANAAALGGEIIQFKSATLVATNRYRISGLLRGRLGTEWATLTHVAGENFVLLDADRIRAIPQAFGEIRREFLYKPVTIGSTLQQTAAQPFTNSGIRRKPLAPWGFAGGRNGVGDLLLKWKPRTRFPVTFGLGVSEPSGETEERYVVYVPSLEFAVRAITVTTPEATYTLAQQIEDYGFAQASIEAEVCQASPEFGLGYLTAGAF